MFISDPRIGTHGKDSTVRRIWTPQGLPAPRGSCDQRPLIGRVASIASCVFADIRNAEKYLEESLSGLDSMGDGLKGRILTVPLPWDEDGDGSTGLYIAVITASDWYTSLTRHMTWYISLTPKTTKRMTR